MRKVTVGLRRAGTQILPIRPLHVQCLMLGVVNGQKVGEPVGMCLSLSSLPSCSSSRNSTASMTVAQEGGGWIRSNQVSSISRRHLWGRVDISRLCMPEFPLESPGELQSSSICQPPCGRGHPSDLSALAWWAHSQSLHLVMGIYNYAREVWTTMQHTCKKKIVLGGSAANKLFKKTVC